MYCLNVYFRYVCTQRTIEAKPHDQDDDSEIYAEIASLEDATPKYTTLDPRTCSEKNLDGYTRDIYESERSLEGCIREIEKRSNTDANSYNYISETPQKEHTSMNNINMILQTRKPATPPSCHNLAYDYNDIDTYDVVLSVPHDGQTRF